MTRHVVIGTAGHVDHGKTALVRALTGVETDRLAEERRRGITIELGFARCRLDDVDAGIVDVPGHEDFVRTMVAGAGGVDVALLVVAADESVMPQTVEHAAILDFLGVPVGVVALTKSDLVEPGWLELVRTDVVERLAPFGTAWTDVVPVSSVTGAGLAELRAALAHAAGRSRAHEDGDLFRLPVDRAFSVAGAGTVVTGTVWSGTARVGDDVEVLPAGIRARVRGVEWHGERQEVAVPGRRTALALTGVDRGGVERGATVVAGPGWRTTDVLDVLVTLLPTAPPIGQRTRVRVHVGTAEILGRVTPAGDAVPPGGSGTVRLRLERPVVARWGDRVVLRSYSPVTTIGGAVVADPWPPARPRRPRDAGPLLGPPPARVAAALARAGGQGLSLAGLPVRCGVPPDQVDAVVAETGAVTVGARVLAPAEVAAAEAAVLQAVGEYHARTRLEPGMSKEAARRAIRDPELADAVLDRLARDGRLVLEGSRVRLPGHDVVLDAREADAVAAVRNALRAAGFEGRTAEEVDLPGTAPEARVVLEHLVREGVAVRLGGDRFLDGGISQEVVDRVGRLLEREGQVGPAQVRDMFGLTRKYAIPLLEWLDAERYTVRQGDVRVAGPRLTGRSGGP